MLKVNSLVLALLLSPLSAAAVEFGDPDSDSAPYIVESETPLPPINNDDDNPDAEANKGDEQIPGAHLVPPTAENQVSEDDKWKEKPFARLQGLNKVTARTSELKADIGKNLKFGNLELVVEKCLRGPENEKIENTALFTIWDEIPGQDKKQVFHGWMFSSSPAISALEHPIYDIILLGCGEAPKAAAMPAADGKKDAKKTDKKSKKPKISTPAE